MAEPEFATERLDIRRWTHDDTAAMYDIYRRWEVARWLGSEPKVAASEEAMHGTVDRWAAACVGPYGIWAVVPRLLGEPVGTVLLVPMHDAAGVETGDVEVGWHFHPDHWGHGYATESAAGALDRAWAAGLAEVYAVVYPGNDASVAVTRRLGMGPRGTTERFYGVELEAYVIERPSADGHQGP